MIDKYRFEVMSRFDYELIEIYYYLVKDTLTLEDKIEIITEYLDL
jgi:hypothetical protein